MEFIISMKPSFIEMKSAIEKIVQEIHIEIDDDRANIKSLEAG